LRAASRRIALDRTTITIAHRMSTIEAAEYLVVLADGHIVERGTPAELAALPTSQYALALANELRGDA
jgi:ATP-binding cassette subfamily B protein